MREEKLGVIIITIGYFHFVKFKKICPLLMGKILICISEFSGTKLLWEWKIV